MIIKAIQEIQEFYHIKDGTLKDNTGNGFQLLLIIAKNTFLDVGRNHEVMKLSNEIKIN